MQRALWRRQTKGCAAEPSGASQGSGTSVGTLARVDLVISVGRPLNARAAAIGTWAAAIGARATTVGARATAIGAGTTTVGARTTAVGAGTTAVGAWTTTIGTGTAAVGAGAATIGRRTAAVSTGAAGVGRALLVVAIVFALVARAQRGDRQRDACGKQGSFEYMLECLFHRVNLGTQRRRGRGHLNGR